MSEYSDHSGAGPDPDDKPAIVKVEGVPKETDDPVSRREFFNDTFKGVSYFLGDQLREGAELAKVYAESKVAQESNAAAKLAADAAEAMSRKEENEARANFTNQQENGEFIKNLKQVEELKDPVLKALAFAKLMKDDPALMAQVEQIQYVIDRLNMEHGTLVEFVPLDGEQQTARRQSDKIGQIVRLINKGDGYGFIESSETQKELFFHSSDLDGTKFKDLRKRQLVTFEETTGPKGPKAISVRPAVHATSGAGVNWDVVTSEVVGSSDNIKVEVVRGEGQ